jgi:hypothetical protein
LEKIEKAEVSRVELLGEVQLVDPGVQDLLEAGDHEGVAVLCCGSLAGDWTTFAI